MCPAGHNSLSSNAPTKPPPPSGTPGLSTSPLASDLEGFLVHSAGAQTPTPLLLPTLPPPGLGPACGLCLSPLHPGTGPEFCPRWQNRNQLRLWVPELNPRSHPSPSLEWGWGRTGPQWPRQHLPGRAQPWVGSDCGAQAPPWSPPSHPTVRQHVLLRPRLELLPEEPSPWPPPLPPGDPDPAVLRKRGRGCEVPSWGRLARVVAAPGGPQDGPQPLCHGGGGADTGGGGCQSCWEQEVGLLPPWPPRDRP